MTTTVDYVGSTRVSDGPANSISQPISTVWNTNSDVTYEHREKQLVPVTPFSKHKPKYAAMEYAQHLVWSETAYLRMVNIVAAFMRHNSNMMALQPAKTVKQGITGLRTALQPSPFPQFPCGWFRVQSRVFITITSLA